MPRRKQKQEPPPGPGPNARGDQRYPRAEGGLDAKVRSPPAHWRVLLPILAASVLPVMLTGELWAEVWGGARSHAWDGSGHQALAQIYSETVFPDTFGWTHAFFGGMPHPNFYPPLFYWLVAALAHTGLVSFLTAFKLVTVMPSLLLPSAVWALAWRVTGKDRVAATCAAFAVIPLLVDQRFYNGSGLLTGLGYTSTFLFGIYTQTLGFVLLLAWYVVYAGARHTTPRFAASSLSLSLALLANFFASNVAVLLVAATLVQDLFRLYRARNPASRRDARQALVMHAASPLAAGCLTLFWLAPVFSARAYFPSSPSRVPLDSLFSPTMTVWYILALAGVVLWLRRPTATMWPYLATCGVMSGAVVLVGWLAPAWLPLHAERLLTTLNFLLAVPVGHLLAAALRKAGVVRDAGAPNSRQANKGDATRRAVPVGFQPFHTLSNVFVLAVFVFAGIGLITPPSFSLAFLPTADGEAIDPLLRFGMEHRDGRYLIETPPPTDTAAAHDGRAIGAYLAAQGNEVASVFFREGSPGVIFFNSLARSLSVYGDATNISSVLIDDKDFVGQPIATHLKQARLLGVRYLVLRSPWARERLAGQPDVKPLRDFGPWSVYELSGGPPARAGTPAYKPALVVSGLSFKQRRSDQYEFVRLAEEQFADGWYDVLLARSPETRLDRLDLPDGFGALVVETYDCDDETAALERLREFAQQRPLILLASDAPLFRRVTSQLAGFPRAIVIEREREDTGAWLEAGPPTRSHESNPVRKTWREIKRILDENKSPAAADEITSRLEQRSIDIAPRSSTPEPVPVLVNVTYHPHWVREDRAAIYAVTPFFMLTFVRGPTRLEFVRSPLDWAGVAASGVTLLLLGGLTLWHYRGHSLRGAGRLKPGTNLGKSGG